MLFYQLENQNITVVITNKASEITSLKSKKTNIEYMWQGDAKFWSGRNPTLFPIVGNTWNKKIEIDGKIYSMGNHGFARHSIFTCTEHTDTKVIMHLEENEDTLSQYPFRFSLDITYELREKGILISYEISNPSDCVMPFNFGLHPAFNCPLKENEKQSEYFLQLNEKDCYTCYGETEICMTDCISLDRSRLEKTMIFRNPKSTEVKLTNGKDGVLLKAIGYPYLAFWSAANNAPFVCIEPWYSHTDFERVEVPFEKREGTILLPGHQVFKASYEISILE